MDRALAAKLAGALLATSAWPRAAGAAEPGFTASGLETHGFVSQGYMKTSSNNYLAKSKANRGSFEFAEVGLNFTQRLSENLRTGIQLFSRDLGPVGNYDIKADWFYVDYRLVDELGFRAGRIKVPHGLYNDVSDIDAARVPILLPQSIYPIRSRDYLLAQTGVELYGRLASSGAGALDYRLYGGTIFIDTPATPGNPIQVLDVTVPYLFGGRLLWETPLEGLRLGMSAQKLRLDTTFAQGMAVTDFKIPVVMWVASIEYARDDLTLTAEYARWSLSSTSTSPGMYPNFSREEERGYLMAAWRLNEWFEPGAYYSLLFPNVDDRKGTDAQQHDVALTLRFDLHTHWLFKLEGHYLVGTADLRADLNDNTPLADLARTWGMFLAKTTAYF